MYGPERFYYDKSSYTGVHTRGGPSTTDNHRVDLKDLMDRSPADVRGVKLAASTKSWGSFRAERTPSGRSLMQTSSGREVVGPAHSSSRRDLSRSSSGRDLVRASSSKQLSPQRTGSSKDLQASPEGGRAVYGPERFFYDKSSFTGVHRHGGPSTIDNHRVELSDLMDRSPADARGVKLTSSKSSGGSTAMTAASLQVERTGSNGSLRQALRSSSGRDLLAQHSADLMAPKSSEFLLSKGAGSGLVRNNSLRRSTSGKYLAAPASGGATDAQTGTGGSGYGPERFFYDQSSYTGVHKRGGPSITDNPRVELHSLMDRSRADVRGVKAGTYRPF